MKPWKHCIWIDAVIQTCQKISEHQTLFSSPMRRHPKPTVAEVVVDEENVALLETAMDLKFGHEHRKIC